MFWYPLARLPVVFFEQETTRRCCGSQKVFVPRHWWLSSPQFGVLEGYWIQFLGQFLQFIVTGVHFHAYITLRSTKCGWSKLSGLPSVITKCTQNPAEFKTHLSLSGRLRGVLPSLWLFWHLGGILIDFGCIPILPKQTNSRFVHV